MAEDTQRQLEAFALDTSTLHLADGSRLQIVSVERVVPGKRLVCRGVWNNQHVYAKIFVGEEAWRYADRDARGVRLLDAAGITTPSLLYVGNLVGSQAKVLVFEEISEVVNAEQQLCTLNADARLKLASLLVQAVAGHHRHGLIQTDLYLKNFLVKENTVYTLDGDGIRTLPWLFKKRSQLKNLATLFSKFDALDDGWIKELYARYCVCAGVENTASDELKLNCLTKKIRHSQASHYADKKVFRSCTDVKVIKTFFTFKAIASDISAVKMDAQFLDGFLANPERNIKNGNTCTVGLAQFANQQVVVKRYNIKNFRHGLNRAFRVSRAAHSWSSAHRLLISNIMTARPLALVEERCGVLRRRAYYVSEYIDAPDVAQFFELCTNDAERAIVARNLAALFHKLYLLRYTHGDFKATNIKIVSLQPLLIDLDAMRAHFNTCFGRFSFGRRHVKDLKRFIHNWHGDEQTQTLVRNALYAEYVASGSNALKHILNRAGIA